MLQRVSDGWRWAQGAAVHLPPPTHPLPARTHSPPNLPPWKQFLELKEADAAAGACTLPPPPPLPAFPAPGDPLLPPDAQVTPLTGDDYFAKAGEFAAWADEARRLAVADLATGDARALFLEFVAAWNARALPARFYDGRAAAPTRRTAHNWGILGRGGGGGRSRRQRGRHRRGRP